MLSLPWLVQNSTSHPSSSLGCKKGERSVPVIGKIYQASQCRIPLFSQHMIAELKKVCPFSQKHTSEAQRKLEDFFQVLTISLRSLPHLLLQNKGNLSSSLVITGLWAATQNPEVRFKLILNQQNSTSQKIQWFTSSWGPHLCTQQALHRAAQANSPAHLGQTALHSTEQTKIRSSLTAARP